MGAGACVRHSLTCTRSCLLVHVDTLRSAVDIVLLGLAILFVLPPSSLYRLTVTDSLAQLVTCVPTRKLPKSFRTGHMTKEEMELMERRRRDSAEVVDPLATDDMGRRGQILWIRGLTRLQHQVSHVPPSRGTCQQQAALRSPSSVTSAFSCASLSRCSNSCWCAQLAWLL